MTLIELLITMAIMAIISAAILGTASAAMEAARRDRTQTLVTKISGLVNERLATYETRRVDLQGSVLAAVNALPNPRDRGMAMAEMRLLAQREAMKFEMPQTWDDFLAPPVILSNKPSLAQGYERKHNALKTLNVNNPTAPFQGAECLFMTVMDATGDGEARTLFSKQDIGDVDDDGMPEFLDGWGQPISWLRWPAGMISDLQPADPATGARLGDADHDPLDMYRRDHVTAAHFPLSGLSTLAQNEYTALVNRNTSGNVYATAYRLVPLIYSAGPDGSSDIIAQPRIIINSSPEKITTLDPYSPTATAGLQVGAPYDDEGDGDNTKDNIHNHLNEY